MQVEFALSSIADSAKEQLKGNTGTKVHKISQIEDITEDFFAINHTMAQNLSPPTAISPLTLQAEKTFHTSSTSSTHTFLTGKHILVPERARPECG